MQSGNDVSVLIRNQAGQKILSVEDWFRLAPPKRGIVHWKDSRSAKELAKAWFRNDVLGIPEELRKLLNSVFGDIQITEAIPECIVQLDNFPGEQRNCDLVVYGYVVAAPLVLSVEAKADEPFGDHVIGAYYDEKVGTSSNVPARIQNLSAALFGRFDSEIRALRYQLLHSAAATVIEAKNRKAAIAVFVVHEFRSPTLDQLKILQNMADWTNFVHAFPSLREKAVGETQLLGPIYVPGGNLIPPSIPLYLGHVITQCAYLHGVKY